MAKCHCWYVCVDVEWIGIAFLIIPLLHEYECVFFLYFFFQFTSNKKKQLLKMKPSKKEHEVSCIPGQVYIAENRWNT